VNNFQSKSFSSLAIDKDITGLLRTGLTLFLVIQFGLLLKFQQPLLNLILLGSVIFGFYFIKNSELMFYFLIIYISVVPTAAFKPGYFPLYTSFNIIFVFIILMALQLVTATENSLIRKSLPISIADILLILFLSWIVVSIIFGYAMNPKKMIIKESEYIFLFGFFWWVTKVKANISWVRKFSLFYVILSTIVALEFIFFVIKSMDVKSMFFIRIVTQQPFLSLFAVPLLIIGILLSHKLYLKLIAFSMVIINIIAVILSQWRALTGGVIITIFVVFLIYSFRNGIKIKSWKIILKIGTVFLIIVVILFTIIVNFAISQDTLESLFRRYESFKSVTGDASWNMRYSGIRASLEEWRLSPIIGRGFGNRFDPRDFSISYDYILDNSYIYILWKTGLIGLVLFLSLLGTIAKHGIILIKNLTDTWQRFYCIALFAGFSGLIFSSYFYLSLVRYRFVIFWAIFLGTIEVLYYYLHKPGINV